MSDLNSIFIFLHRIEKLKTVQRAINISDNTRRESPAEHTRRAAIMAMVLHRELKLDIDLLKSLEIVLVHDIVEAVAGDVWIVDKNDKKAHDEQEEKELKAAEELYSLLPSDMGTQLKDLRFDYENGSSKEAKFAKALDKLEVLVQRYDVGVENREKRDFKIYDILINRAKDLIDDFPELREFWELVKNKITEEYESLKATEGNNGVPIKSGYESKKGL